MDLSMFKVRGYGLTEASAVEACVPAFEPLFDI